MLNVLAFSEMGQKAGAAGAVIPISRFDAVAEVDFGDGAELVVQGGSHQAPGAVVHKGGAAGNGTHVNSYPVVKVREVLICFVTQRGEFGQTNGFWSVEGKRRPSPGRE